MWANASTLAAQCRSALSNEPFAGRRPTALAQSVCIYYFLFICLFWVPKRVKKELLRVILPVHPLSVSTVTSLKPGCRDKLAPFSTSHPSSRLLLLLRFSQSAVQISFSVCLFSVLCILFFYFLVFCLSLCCHNSIAPPPPSPGKFIFLLHHAFLVSDHINATLIIPVKRCQVCVCGCACVCACLSAGARGGLWGGGFVLTGKGKRFMTQQSFSGPHT